MSFLLTGMLAYGYAAFHPGLTGPNPARLSVPNPAEWVEIMIQKLTENHIRKAAKELECDVAAIKAVIEVEAPRGGFLEDSDRPVMLFEAHIFSRLTGHKYDDTHPEVSSKRWNRKLYIGGEAEYARLETAMRLDRDNALRSASWGRFQILGDNYALCGFESVQDFVGAMEESEEAHLRAFINYIKNRGLDKYLRNRQWTSFARAYNGAGYSLNKYHIKIAEAYKKYCTPG